MKYNKLILSSIIVMALNLNANEVQKEVQEETMLNKVQQKASELINTAKEKMSSVSVESIKNTASSSWDKAKDEVNGLKENNTTTNLINKASTSISSLKEYINTDSNTSALDTVKEIGTSIKEKYKELIK